MNIPSFCWSPCTKLILAYTCVRTISCNCIVINFAPLNPKPISLKKKKILIPPLHIDRFVRLLT